MSNRHVYANWPKTISSENPETSSLGTESDDRSIAEDDEPEWRCNYYGDYATAVIKPFTTHDLICWAFQVARGMDYLASKKVRLG